MFRYLKISQYVFVKEIITLKYTTKRNIQRKKLFIYIATSTYIDKIHMSLKSFERKTVIYLFALITDWEIFWNRIY